MHPILRPDQGLICRIESLLKRYAFLKFEAFGDGEALKEISNEEVECFLLVGHNLLVPNYLNGHGRGYGKLFEIGEPLR